MVKALAITGALGIAFPRYIDNWGHAGGAIIGLPLGLTHRIMLARRGRPGAWGLGVVATLAIVASAIAQARSDRLEARGREGQEIRVRLGEATRTMRALQALRQWSLRGGDARLAARALEMQAAALDRPATAAAYRRLRTLVAKAAETPLDEAETQAFGEDLDALLRRQRQEFRAWQGALWDHQRKAAGAAFGGAP
jgi:hypothetical protein